MLMSLCSSARRRTHRQCTIGTCRFAPVVLARFDVKRRAVRLVAVIGLKARSQVNCDFDLLELRLHVPGIHDAVGIAGQVQRRRIICAEIEARGAIRGEINKLRRSRGEGIATQDLEFGKRKPIITCGRDVGHDDAGIPEEVCENLRDSLVGRVVITYIDIGCRRRFGIEKSIRRSRIGFYDRIDHGKRRELDILVPRIVHRIRHDAHQILQDATDIPVIRQVVVSLDQKRVDEDRVIAGLRLER